MNTGLEIDKLNKASILDDETLYKVFEEKDRLERTKLIVALQTQATQLNVRRQFDTLLKAMEAEFRTQMGGGRGNYTEFGLEAYSNYYCGPWICNEKGVSQLNQFGEQIWACTHPILPVKILENAETGYVKVVVAFKIRNSWKTIIIDKDVLSSSAKIVQLSNHGVRVTSENARALVRYMSDIESFNESDITVQTSTSKLGWTKSGFMPYCENITFDNEDGISSLYNAIKEHGNYDKWLALVRKLRKRRRLEIGLYMAGAFASPMLNKLHALPFILDLYGETGKGKTVTLMVATSIYADPTEGKYWIRSDNTAVGLEVILDALNHLPLCVDDLARLQNKVKNDFSEYVYTLCAGGGKTRSNVKLGIQRARTWNNVILTSSERSLVNDTMQGGAINRIIEVETEDELFDNISGSETVRIIKANYGFAGKQFIELIEELGIDKIKAIQDEFTDKIHAQCEIAQTRKESKQILPMSILLTADKIATDYIFKDGIYLDFEKCFDLLKNHDETSENERAHQYILSEVQIHMNNFIPQSNGEYRGEIWGRVIDGYVCIISNIFDRIADAGNFSRRGYVKWAIRKGNIRTDKDGKGTRKCRIYGDSPTRCVCIKLDEAMFEPIKNDELPFD